MNGIAIKNISKNFGNINALDNVTITFEENKIYGLLGRNGAGKSTLLNIITNRIFSDSGSIMINNQPARENDQALRKVYLMSERDFYPESMKVKDAFKWTKEFYPDFDMEYAVSLSEKFTLNIKSKIKSLSTGYTTIFKVITALASNVPYILLDEPILGLDANHRDLLYKIIIEKYSQFPCTIVMSTHLIEEIAPLIEDVIIIKEGKVISNDSKEELLSKGYTVSGPASLIEKYIEGKNVLSVHTIGGLKTAYVLEPPAHVNLPEGLEAGVMDLQTLFIQLTNI